MQTHSNQASGQVDERNVRQHLDGVRILLRLADQGGDELVFGFGGEGDLAHGIAAFVQGFVALDHHVLVPVVQNLGQLHGHQIRVSKR